MNGRKAFTLVEMLIVIAIIAILAVLAVSAYGGARRSAQIDLAADSLVSALKYQQSLARSGRVSGDDDAEKDFENRCFGMYFLKNPKEDDPQVYFVETPYYAVKGDRADICDLENAEKEDYETLGDFELFMIEMYSEGRESDELLVIFKPPFARVFVGDMNSIASPGQQYSPYIKFGVSLPGGDNPKYFRLDTSTGLTERIYGEQTKK